MARNTTMKDRDARYYELLSRVYGPRASCKLTLAPRDRKNGKCSACMVQIGEFEFDEVISNLVRNGKIRTERVCPFFIFSGVLASTLGHGLEAELKSQENERFAISELRRALKFIAGALNSLGREEIYIHHAEDPFYGKLIGISASEVLLTEALKALKARYKAPIAQRGRPPKLDAQDITQACSKAWRMLMRKEPGKNNASFLVLLSGTWTTVYGEQRREPSWGHHIDSLKQQTKKKSRK
jgi:hypothetical protein